VIAPILLPILALFASLSFSPSPILEWHVVSSSANSCVLDVRLATTSSADVSKLSLVPCDPAMAISMVSSPVSCDNQWSRNDAMNWMWHRTPRSVNLEVTLDWENASGHETKDLVDVVWEQVVNGERHEWTLGTLKLPAEHGPIHSDHMADPSGKRSATELNGNQVEVTLDIEHVQSGSFVKWTEYIPEGCVCEVMEASGASLRATANAQIFLWFMTDGERPQRPSYLLTCPQLKESWTFDGELEVAFGTETKTSHIAEVVWVETVATLNENMELNQAPDVESVATAAVHRDGAAADKPASNDVRFWVQMLANHKDLSPSEFAEATGFSGDFTIYRHEGWHKYLTSEKTTYADARDFRSHAWEHTLATDAFVTASLEGERIPVQEALLLLNQNWIP